MKVGACFQSTDFLVNAFADVSRWYQRASDEDILETLKVGFYSGYPYELIAELIAETDPEVRQVLTYVNSPLTSAWYEVYVNVEAVEEWIRQERPHLLPAVQARRRSREATTDELRAVMNAGDTRPCT